MPRAPREVPLWRLQIARAYHAAAGDLPRYAGEAAAILGVRRPR